MAAMVLTGFADEISPDLNEQLDVLQSEGIRHLEFRGVWGTNVLRLSDAQIDQVGAELRRRNMGVSSIGSPIGKIKISDDFEPHLRDFRRALELARRLEAPFIRIFSFFVEDPVASRDEVMRRMFALASEAEGQGVTLVHENEKQIYGDVPSRCLDILQTVDRPVLRAAWDPANFVQCGVQPHTQGWDLLAPFVVYVHVKDVKRDTGQVVPFGQGDGEVERTMRVLRDRGFDGFLSLEPHLKAGDTFSGFSGPDLFRVAAAALKEMLARLDIAWS